MTTKHVGPEEPELMVLPCDERFFSSESVWLTFCEMHCEVKRDSCCLSKLVRFAVEAEVDVREEITGQEVYR